eukprot:CAMPEP_0179852188 /NCGR_PEP_ID=MMETSP0982-20121206/8662_1 /TAXON_ID=483367 /ORGANISM="non described non described, Strain CCMP 2436" /LENGTH=438 /DNA_ID=CAMNT_0021737781 /DNA_START=79 /DNA_END=1397 /DNA_ORIENTATION=-
MRRRGMRRRRRRRRIQQQLHYNNNAHTKKAPAGSGRKEYLKKKIATPPLPTVSPADAAAAAAALVREESGWGIASLATFPAYKSTRSATPLAILNAAEPIRDLLEALGIPTLVAPLAEADDVIATLAYAELRRSRTSSVVVVSPDKDFRQLLTESRVRLLRPRSGKAGRASKANAGSQFASEGLQASAPSLLGISASTQRATVGPSNGIERGKAPAGSGAFEWYSASDYLEESGVPASQFCDLAALVGDAVDDVPGVPGVGPVTASSLLRSVAGTVEELVQRAAVSRVEEEREAHQKAHAPKLKRRSRTKPAAPVDASDPVAVAAAAAAAAKKSALQPPPVVKVPAKVRKALLAVWQHAPSALLSKQLVTLDAEVQLPANWTAAAFSPQGIRCLPPDVQAARALLERYEVRSPRVLKALLDEYGGSEAAAAEVWRPSP